MTYKLLHFLSFLIMKVGNHLVGLVLKIRQQARHVLTHVIALLGLGQARFERQNELVQSLLDTVYRMMRRLRLPQHLLQTHNVSPLQGILPPTKRP